MIRWLDMTNTGKMLIVGLLVIDAGIAGYLLFPKEQRPPAVTGAVTGSASTKATDDSQAGDTHVAAGSVIRATPSSDGGNAKLAAVAPAAPVVKVAPDANQATSQAANESRPATRTTIASTDVQPPVHTKSKPSVRAEQVRERKRDEPHRGGSDEVSAALTAQLVKESAKPDPSLPLPPGSSNGSGSGSSGRSSNPVASAMTDQLVRESSKVNLATPAQSYKP